jgi:hypothetical protein
MFENAIFNLHIIPSAKARLGTSAASTSSHAATRASRDSSQPAKKG